MKKSLIWVLFLAIQCAARSQSPVQPEVWHDPDTGASVVVGKAPPSVDGQAVRNQVAGVFDVWLEKPFLPIEFGRATIGRLPTFYMRGALLVEPEPQSVLVVISFAKEQTFIGIVNGPDDVDFPYVEKHARISGIANSAAPEVLDEIVTRSHAGLAELKRAAVARNHAAFEKFREEIRKGDAAIETVKAKQRDLAASETNAEALNRRLRALKPARIYGWGEHRVSDTERSITFIYEFGGKTSMLVWIVNTKDQISTNISTEVSKVEALRVKKQLNLPADARLITYDPEYDMNVFKNSDYYRGRGSDPKGRLITLQAVPGGN